jgi:hypothetical protein
MPTAASRSRTRSRPSTAPESTVARAALNAPIDTCGSVAAASAASYGLAQVAIIPPPDGRYCI